MLKCNYGHQFGEVVYPDEITASNAYVLREACRQFAREYFYQDISIVFLNNLGGEATGLAVIQNTLSELRSASVRVKTRGVGTVASAAAVALSLGTLGSRDVLPGTHVLFHFARVDGAAGVTNQLARQLSKRLESHDERLLQDLVEHIAPLTKFSTEDPGMPIYCWPLTSVVDGNLPRIDLSQREFTDQLNCKHHMSDLLQTP
jgi:ATP-dependent protease ClpP protease subunit